MRIIAVVATLKAMPPDGISIVVPVYNSEATLSELATRLDAVIRPLSAAYEIIFVNDGSRDGSWAAIEKLAAQRSEVRGINLMRNYGQHNALLCGVRAAQLGTIVTIDDDLQNPPEEIPALLAKMNEGFDVVYGTPAKQQHGFLRDMASSITKMVLQGAMGAETARKVSAFRAFRTQLRDAFADYRNPYVSLDVLLTWSTSHFAAVQVRHEPRKVGQSNYTLAKLMTHALNMMTGFSTWPLRMASLAGFGFTLFGIAILVFVVARYFTHGTAVQGFAFLASIIAIFSGAQLFALGVIGEYLARIHQRGMERPTYAVRETAGEKR